MKIKKGDKVIVIAGKDRGKSGTVLHVFLDRESVIVEDLNMRKRHQKARKQGQVGQIIECPVPIHVSNVSLIDPKTKKPTRVRYSIVGNEKVRIAVKSGQKI